jgi:hypothetical protein
VLASSVVLSLVVVVLPVVPLALALVLGVPIVDPVSPPVPPPPSSPHAPTSVDATTSHERYVPKTAIARWSMRFSSARHREVGGAISDRACGPKRGGREGVTAQ